MPVIDIASNGQFKLDRMTWQQFIRAIDLLFLVTTHTVYSSKQGIIVAPIIGSCT